VGVQCWVIGGWVVCEVVCYVGGAGGWLRLVVYDLFVGSGIVGGGGSVGLGGGGRWVGWFGRGLVG